jgi:hypothetical protein
MILQYPVTQSITIKSPFNRHSKSYSNFSKGHFFWKSPLNHHSITFKPPFPMEIPMEIPLNLPGSPRDAPLHGGPGAGPRGRSHGFYGLDCDGFLWILGCFLGCFLGCL